MGATLFARLFRHTILDARLCRERRLSLCRIQFAPAFNSLKIGKIAARNILSCERRAKTFIRSTEQQQQKQFLNCAPAKMRLTQRIMPRRLMYVTNSDCSGIMKKKIKHFSVCPCVNARRRQITRIPNRTQPNIGVMQQQRLGHCFTSHSGTLYLSACSLFIVISEPLPFYFIIILMWFPVINVGHHRKQCDNAQMKRWRKKTKLYTKICHTANDWSISLSSSTSFHIHSQPLFWTPRCWLMAGILSANDADQFLSKNVYE